LQEKVIIIDLKELRRQSLRRLTFGLVWMAIAFLTGCVYSRSLNTGNNNNNGNNGGNNGMGHLYVSSQGQNEILIFSGATTLNGAVMTPTATVTSNTTNTIGGMLANPQYIFSDATNDRLYVANQGGKSILVFDGVSKLTGSVGVTATRVITSNDFTAPSDVQVDTTRDVLYVADNNNAIIVIPHASTATGAATVTAVINPGFNPSALLVDSVHNILFVANSAGSSVGLFTNASGLSGAGTLAPNLTLQGAVTQLNGPAGLQIDGAGRLLVGNTGSASITVYNNASTLNGNIQPIAVISNKTPPLAAPAQLAIDPTTNNGELYLADTTDGEIFVFTNLGQASGTLTGQNLSRQLTGLTTPRGVAIDTTH
jgi:6-phosphogluconolactonase (cycloisomerase 2 family)